LTLVVAVSALLVLLAVPSAFFVLEVVAALPPARASVPLSSASPLPSASPAAPGRPPPASSEASSSGRRKMIVPQSPMGARVAVLVPAHDEAAGIAAALATILPQLRLNDRLLVVADNCSDDTAGVARAAGAEVLERRDEERRGKGWALAAGIDALAARPPDVVIIVDADCHVSAGAIELLREAALEGPTQASYLMRAPEGAPRSRRLAELLFVVRNHVRPLGLLRIGAPCLFTGSGMALPWPIARGAPFAGGSVVEDTQLAVDLAAVGTPVHFCPEAQVVSWFPTSERAADAQRARWLWGNLRAAAQAPRLLAAAVRHSRLGLVPLAAELTVPPLSLLFPGWVAVAALAAFTGAREHEWRPLIAAGVWLGLSTLAVVAAWARFARDRIPLSVIVAAPFYALPTIGSAVRALFRRRQAWNRTGRD
jgi:hypothetical protein